MENQITGKTVAEDLSRIVNRMSYGSEDSKGFVHTVTSDHRTLQQQSFGLMMQCIETWSKMENFDARNEYTVKMCKKMMEAVKDDWYGRPPMI